ncbi:hypothetical protein CRUP_029213 [Coryphaenoides rupestris]|nr:hypothetical protein CRUP_029213 [Coryphaenoides rupestris]
MTTNTNKSCPIPTKILTLNDWSQLPDCYSQTPGGTLFSTTPGGTRIIYDRKFLLECRNSPIAKTPPCCLPQIPGVTVPATHPIGKLQDLKEEMEEEEKDMAGTQVYTHTHTHTHHMHTLPSSAYLEVQRNDLDEQTQHTHVFTTRSQVRLFQT